MRHGRRAKQIVTRSFPFEFLKEGRVAGWDIEEGRPSCTRKEVHISPYPCFAVPPVS
jgi:hypothetical protein